MVSGTYLFKRKIWYLYIMIDFIVKAFTAVPLWELALILVLKMIEVAVATLRSILINKGYRREGTMLSFVEILLWTFVASRVIMGIASAPIKGIAYSIGFFVGVYLGSKIEGHIAMGRVLIQAIVSKDNASLITEFLRDKGYAVTTMEAQGRDSSKMVLMIFAYRKGKEEIIGKIQQLDSSAMVITNDVTALHGGHIRGRRKLLK